MIRYLQLPFQFDASRMYQEVLNIEQDWRAHFNTGAYQGSWSGLSLRAPGGRLDNILTEQLGGESHFENTPLLNQCPYIKSVLQSLECPQTSVRLLKLEHGTIVKEHTDAGLNFEEGEARLHIPVYTHELVDFYLDGDRLNMQVGECWYINASLPHRLSNQSPVDRIHLVIDCMVNDWLTACFSQNDLPVKSIKDTSAQDLNRQLQVIAELKRSGDPAMQEMAARMEREMQPADIKENNQLTEIIIGFIRSVGIEVTGQPLDGDTFLPGISIERGSILIDRKQLKHPGDLLHEAGHIAVVPLAERATLDAAVLGQRKDHASEEMMAMAWSYAACHHLGMDVRVVFHEYGYKGGSESILQSMQSSMPLGAPMLQYIGLAWNRHLTPPEDFRPFPAMRRWVRG